MESLPFGGDNDGTQLYGSHPEDWIHTPAMQSLLAHEGTAPSAPVAAAPKQPAVAAAKVGEDTDC